MQIWLNIFVSWPLPGPPISVTARRVVAEHRRGAVERRGVAADHDRELAVFGARLAAGYRRIEKADAFALPPRRGSRARSRAEAVV